MDLQTMCLQGSAMIVVVALVRLLLFKHLPKSVFVLLWCLVLVRLLVPFSLVVPFNAWSLVSLDAMPLARTVASDQLEPANPASPNSAPADLAPANPASPNSAPADPTFAPSSQATAADPLAAPAPDTPGLPDLLASPDVWRVCWVVGCAVAAVAFVLVYRRGMTEYACSLPVDSDYAREWLSYHKIRRPLQIRQHDRIVSPLTYGLFKPVILVPADFDWEDRGGARIVLEHEFTHIVRWDAVRKALLVVAVCLYWFNPLVWLMFVLANRDIELTCDEQVARALTPKGRVAYVRALVDLAETRSLVPMASHFGQTAVEERVRAIRGVRDMGVMAALAMSLLAVGLSAAFATTPMSADEYAQWSGQTGRAQNLAPQPESPTEVTDVPDAHIPGMLPGEAAGPREHAMAGARVVATPHYAVTLFDHVAGEGCSWEYDAQPRTVAVGDIELELSAFLTVTLGAGSYAGQSFVVYCMRESDKPVILDNVSLLGPEYVEASTSRRSTVDESLRVRVAAPRASASQLELAGGSVYESAELDTVHMWATFVSNGSYYPISAAEKGGVCVRCPGYSVFIPQEELDAGLTWSYRSSNAVGEHYLSLFVQDGDRVRNETLVVYALVTCDFYAVNESNASVSVALLGPCPTDDSKCYAVLSYASNHASAQAANEAVATWLPRATLTQDAL